MNVLHGVLQVHMYALLDAGQPDGSVHLIVRAALPGPIISEFISRSICLQLKLPLPHQAPPLVLIKLNRVSSPSGYQVEEILAGVAAAPSDPVDHT